MGVDPIVNMAINMKMQSVHEQAGIRVVKLAMDMAQQTGDEIIELMDDSEALSDPDLGNLVDISA